jgi:hypothetical protein
MTPLSVAFKIRGVQYGLHRKKRCLVIMASATEIPPSERQTVTNAIWTLTQNAAPNDKFCHRRMLFYMTDPLPELEFMKCPLKWAHGYARQKAENTPGLL